MSQKRTAQEAKRSSPDFAHLGSAQLVLAAANLACFFKTKTHSIKAQSPKPNFYGLFSLEL
jgi:hypothetical protein